MPRNNLTKLELLPKLHELKNELNQKEENSKAKNLANEYLNKILDYAEQFRY
jgi:hypothetical protein|tara:strand:- start:1043 stop:1198 length:156 start_codon:yes stop_codon:yes gene_type:complete